jgi:RimJ/RimL family protein N-acetyltransferase
MASSADPAFSSLRTERVVIDRLVSADIPIIAAYRNNPNVAEFQSWPIPYSAELAERLVASTLGEGDPLIAGGQLAIRTTESPPVLIGDVMVEGVAGTAHALELGVTVAPPWQRLGYAREALRALIEALFADARVHRLTAYVDVDNGRSLRLFDRLGFHREGVLRSSLRRRDQSLADEVVFGLTRTQWSGPDYDHDVIAFDAGD